MGETNKSLRIRTNVGTDKYVSVNLTSEYDTLEILSLKINQRGAYRHHINTYGVVVGRVLANNGFGVPNAKLSLFIERDDNTNIIEQVLYPYTTVGSKNNDGIRYNLLPSIKKDDCHQVVGTFPSKRMLLDDNSMLEVFDKYYMYTTRTNESGDYMFFGVPTGQHTLHMDLDISDCGKLSQRPRDLVEAGYNLEQFENPNQFKISTELSSLPQIFSQDVVVDVKAFWGDSQDKSSIGITREDINVKYTFKPTCVFMGSMVSDNPNDGINKKCIATNKMGDMRDIITGSGTIEIIRKTINNTVEELQIKGKQLIDGNGVWCFQIPMNLDYVTTDEYGNTVPTDNPDKGIATRCEVRFRVSMNGDNSENVQYKHGKVLIPNNPSHENSVDYAFGSDTRDESFKSLMWNGVYSVKSFIPRFQKSVNVNTNKFTGFKNVNIHGSNNPIPFNNIRIRIPFMFWLMCNVIKLFIRIIQIINNIKVGLMKIGIGFINLPYSYIGNEVCPDLEYWYFAPGMNSTAPPNNIFRKFWRWLTGNKKDNACKTWQEESVCLTFKDIAASIENPGGENSIGDVLYEYIGTGNEKKSHVVSVNEIADIVGDDVIKIRTINDSDDGAFSGINGDYDDWHNWIKVPNSAAPLDKMSTDAKNAMTNIEPKIHLTPDVDYLMQCVEMNLAQEYEVIKFDFYNDWINGMVYIPRWARSVKYKKKTKNGATEVIQRIKGCIGNYSTAARKYTQQCALTYDTQMNIKNPVGCSEGNDKLQCHKKQGMQYVSVLGQNGGIVHEEETMLHDFVYYMKPRDGSVLMFATDIIMLGSLFDCNEYGISSVFESLVDTTYKLPTNLAMTNTDQDSYAYLDRSEYPQDGPPTIPIINAMKCNTSSGCALKHLAASGVTATIPSYDDLSEMMYARGEIQKNSQIVIEYDDIFPVTEMAGIEWGYKGPEFDKKNNSDNKLFSPGGHFMGLACGNAETNIKSCVNLQRACEIGTSYSERFEIPMGFSNKSSEYDVVNYLYVAPNGVIGKDQVVDVTFRSVFATLNQNALQTEVDPTTKHKKYKFQYLIPDNFDNTIEKKLVNTSEYNTQIQLEWDNYWSNVTSEDMKGMTNAADMFNSELQIEQGYTITRLLDASANDYLNFRYGDTNPRNMGFLLNFNRGFSMPQYKNSFYFYFGLKKGSTALDEFRKQFFASCAKSSIVGEHNKIEYDYVQSNSGFKYDVTIKTPKIKLPLSYTLKGVDNNQLYSLENVNNDVFIIRDVVIGVYNLTITDADGEDFFETLEIGVDDFIVDYDITTIKHYIKDEKRKTIDEFAAERKNNGCIEGTFNVTEVYKNDLGLTYKACIKHADVDVEVGDENWNKLYDSTTNTFWCYGFGRYEVYIREYKPNSLRYSGERKYGEFEIKDGKPDVIFKLGTVNYFDENGISNFNIKTIDEAVNLDSYEKFKTITSPYKMGEALFNLAFSHESINGDYEGIYAGKPEKISSNENDKDLYEGLCLTTDVPNGYMLHFDSLRYPSDWNDRGDFYFTAYLNGNFASIDKKVPESYEFNIESEVDANGEPTGKRIVNVELEKNGVYCLVAGFEKRLIIITDDNKKQQVYVNVDSSIEKAYVGEMVNAPWFSYPFSFEMIKILDTVTDDYKLIGTPQAYQNKVERIYEGTTLYLHEYTNGLTLAETNRKLRLTAPNWGNVSVLRLKYSHTGDDDNIKLSIVNLNDSLPLSGNTNYKFYLHVSNVGFESDFEVNESSDFDISVGYTEAENGLYRFDEPIFFEGKEIGSGIVYDSSEIQEKIVYWGYEDNCLTLYGLGIIVDENTGDDVYDENTIVDSRWVYRGVITVDGKQYDKWEDVNDANYNCCLTNRIVKLKEIEGSLKNSETCFTYNKTFKEGVNPTYEILNALEITPRYEGTSLIMEREISLSDIVNKKIWSFATYTIERGNKNDNYRLNDFKKVQMVKIFNNHIDNIIVSEIPSFYVINPYVLDETISEYLIYERDRNMDFYVYDRISREEKEIMIVSDAEYLNIRYSPSAMNLFRIKEAAQYQIDLENNEGYNHLPKVTNFESKKICYSSNELGNKKFNYDVRFGISSPFKVISRIYGSNEWLEEGDLGVAVIRRNDDNSNVFKGFVMNGLMKGFSLVTENLKTKNDYEFIIYYKN